jgi:C-terminal peptidase prc
VLAFLRQLSREPSNRGMAARFLLDRAARNNGGAPDLLRRLDELEAENAALAERLARRAGTAASGVPADGGPIPELIDLIREHYVDPGAVDDRKLAIEAFEALSAQIDHVTFLSPDDLERMRANTLGRNLGLGAEFFKLNRGSPLIVVRSFHSRRGAAANRRLQAGDRVVSIDAVSTRGLGPDDIRRLLDKKQRGDRVELEVERWEWEEPRRVEVEYGVVEVPDLFHALLPRGIGYVRLERFRKDTASELAAAIALLESEHRGALEAFIFDLRNNGGGPLDQAVKVVDLFVDDAELPIVSEVGRGGRAVREYMPLPGANLACPLVVLINRWTASSAEVVAGSLQDFRRATIVGRRSYGKGVSQQRFDAPESVSKLVGGPAAIVLPNHYLHLPSGRRFHTPRDARGQPLAGHEGGIEPDVVVADREDEAEGWEREEFLRVQHSDELFRYVKARYAELRSRWKEGVRELRDPANYPDFARLYASLHTRLGEEQVLVALRRLLGRHLEEEVERDLATMISEDRQLRRALKVLGIGPESSPEYARWLPDEAADE